MRPALVLAHRIVDLVDTTIMSDEDKQAALRTALDVITHGTAIPIEAESNAATSP
jgi:hypothetical protein